MMFTFYITSPSVLIILSFIARLRYEPVVAALGCFMFGGKLEDVSRTLVSGPFFRVFFLSIVFLLFCLIPAVTCIDSSPVTRQQWWVFLYCAARSSVHFSIVFYIYGTQRFYYNYYNQENSFVSSFSFSTYKEVEALHERRQLLYIVLVTIHI